MPRDILVTTFHWEIPSRLLYKEIVEATASHCFFANVLQINETKY